MTEIYYDLHIHSALSPCADNDMTPNDIVSMALLNGLDVIAITDHNSFGNVEAVMKAAHGKELIVLPGAEIETREEVHVLCIFCDLESAFAFEKELTPFYSNIPNRVDIYGEQILYNEEDIKVGEIERMLLAACSISFDALYNMVKQHGGAFIPAHIDREANSALNNLGFLPPDLDIPVVEISALGLRKGFAKKHQSIASKHRLISSSDAHRLWDISERIHSLKIPEQTSVNVINFLHYLTKCNDNT